MPDPTALLERTTPRDLPELDVDRLARTAHRRTRRRRALVVAGAIALFAAPLAVLAAVDRGDEADHTTEGLGEWHRAADPPFAPRTGASAVTLADGRVFVWGGDTGQGGASEPLTDGGIYDPDADEWTPVEDAPIDGGVTGGGQSYGLALAGDRIAVFSLKESPDVAVYDVGERRWIEVDAPAQTTGRYADGFAWDGEHLAIVVLPSSNDPNPVGLTLRWSVADPRWTEGEPSPLRLAFQTTVVRDPRGTRLAVDSHGLAIYDLGTDSWTVAERSPLATDRFGASLSWQGDAVVVAARREGGGVARFDTGTGRWTTLPELPTATQLVGRVAMSVNPERGWVLVGANWVPTPTYTIDQGGSDAYESSFLRVVDVDGRTVATSSGFGNGGSNPYAVVVYDPDIGWQDAEGAPFDNLMDETLAVSGTRLVVIGGLPGDGPATKEAWVLDLGED